MIIFSELQKVVWVEVKRPDFVIPAPSFTDSNLGQMTYLLCASVFPSVMQG